MAIVKQSVGIDIAKDKFDVCFSVLDEQQKVTIKSTRKFLNTPAGFTELEAWIKKLAFPQVPLVLVMEATGVYYEQLAWALYGQGHYVSVVLPNKAKRYAQSLGIKSKNDRIDAKALSRMAAEQVLERWQPLSNELYALRVLTRQIESFQQFKTQLNNQLHALEHSRVESKSAMKRIRQQMQLLDKSVLEIKAEVKKIVDKDALLKAKLEQITAIKGVGLMSAVTVIAETDGFALIRNQRQLVSYAGYDVVENQSGNRTGKTRISKKGNAHLRRILHLPAFSVVRYGEPVFKALDERLIARGKTKMQAYVAVQKKLLVLIYTLWKKDQAYLPAINQSLEKEASENEEPRLLSSVGSRGATKQVAPALARATQDRLPVNELPKVLSSVRRS